MSISNHIASAKPIRLVPPARHLACYRRVYLGRLGVRRDGEKIASQRADAAVVQALAPICVQNFRVQLDAATQLVSLKKLSTYEQRGFVEKGGWRQFQASRMSILPSRGLVPMR